MDFSYATWAKDELGVEVDPRLEIRELEGDDERGIYVKDKAIPPQSTLARVPFSSLLTIEQLPRFPILSKVAKLLTREDDILALMLIHERHRGAKSKWSKHIACLPKQYHSIANYSDEDLELIKGCNLQSVAKKWKTQIQQDYDEVMQHLSDAGLRNSSTSIFSQITIELYRWCLSTIWSRFISIEYRSGKVLRAMVPLIDFLNHNPKIEVGHHYHQADDYLYLVAGGQQRFKQGDELFLNYGPLSNSKLLMLYGFCLLDNPFNDVEIWATMTTSTMSLPNIRIFEKKQRILESLGILPNRIDNESPDSTNVIASYNFPIRASDLLNTDNNDIITKHDILIFLRLQHSDTEEISRWTEAQWSALLAGRQRLSVSNERQALQSLLEAVESMINGYTNSLEEDAEVLSPLLEGNKKKHQVFIHPSNHCMHAAMLTYGEKHLLKMVKAIITSLIANFDIDENP